MIPRLSGGHMELVLHAPRLDAQLSFNIVAGRGRTTSLHL